MQPSETSESSRSSRKRARTRADLLAAARQRFAAQGYHATSIAEITETADVGVGTFYLHFRDKDDIMHVLVEEELAQLRTEVADALGGGTPSLPVLIRTIFRFAHGHRELFSIILTGGGSLEVALRWRSQLILGLELVLHPAVLQGALTGDEVPLLARMLSGIIVQSILWWSDHDTPDPDGMTGLVLRLLREGLPAGLFAEPPSPGGAPATP